MKKKSISWLPLSIITFIILISILAAVYIFSYGKINELSWSLSVLDDLITSNLNLKKSENIEDISNSERVIDKKILSEGTKELPDMEETDIGKIDKIISILEGDKNDLYVKILKENFGQLFFVGTKEYKVNNFNKSIIYNLIRDYNIGGYLLRRDAFQKNEKQLKSVLEWFEFTTTLKATAKKNGPLPIFLAADHEGGDVSPFAKIDAVTEIPSAMAISTARNKSLTCVSGYLAGDDLKDLGINTNFAPVLDVQFNVEELVIKGRSFGSDPDFVAKMAQSFVRGLGANNILTVGKHYPGHGKSEEGVHTPGMVESDINLGSLHLSLKPFRELSENGVDMMMTAFYRATDLSEETNVAFDKKIINLLKIPKEDTLYIKGQKFKGLGFPGIVITDDILVKGLLYENKNKLNIDVESRISDLSIKAFESGHDMILIGEIQSLPIKKIGENFISSDQFSTIYRALYDHIFNTENSLFRRSRMEQLQKSLLRIFKVKKKLLSSVKDSVDLNVDTKNHIAKQLWRETFVYKVNAKTPLNLSKAQNGILIIHPTNRAYKKTLLDKPELGIASFERWRLSRNIGELLREKGIPYEAIADVKNPEDKENCGIIDHCRKERYALIKNKVKENGYEVILYLFNTRSQWDQLLGVLDLFRDDAKLLNKFIVIPTSHPSIMARRVVDTKGIDKVNYFIPFAGYNKSARYAAEYLLDDAPFSLREGREQNRNLPVYIEGIQDIMSFSSKEISSELLPLKDAVPSCF